MTLSELITEYGEDNLQLQYLDQATDSLNMKGGVTKITFGAEQPIDMNGTVKLGIVVWLDRDRVAEIIKQSKAVRP